MKRETIELLGKNQNGLIVKLPVKAYVHKGIALHTGMKDYHGKNEYVLTHVQSGMRIYANFMSFKHAKELLVLSADTLDWTQDYAQLKKEWVKLKEAHERIKTIYSFELGGTHIHEPMGFI